LEPMNPAPPVTRIVSMGFEPPRGAVAAGEV
jgi:hypothetical protein